MSAGVASRTTIVNLLTGFLGSGKTTLLRRLLRDPFLARSAVLINEFGEVGLDHHLVERIDETTVLLRSGCLCCTIRGDLSDAVRALQSRRSSGLIPDFDRIVIESTGLADPFPILSTLRADPVLRHHFQIGAVVTTVDAVNAPGQMEGRVELVKQVASADRILLTKTDLADVAVVRALSSRLSVLNPTAALRDVHDASWSAKWLMTPDQWISTRPIADAMRQEWADEVEAPHGHAAEGKHSHSPNRHGDSVQAFSVVAEDEIDWTAFGIWLTMLLNRHGTRILRVKGILNLSGEERPVAVHGVQHLVHSPVHMERWEGSPCSRLVFIVDGLDPALIRRSFDAFCRTSLTREARHG